MEPEGADSSGTAEPVPADEDPKPKPSQTRRDTLMHTGSDLGIIPCPAQEQLRNAAKARIRRMVAPKSKRTDLAVPDWLRTAWEKGTKAKDELADCLQHVNWNKEPNLWLKLSMISCPSLEEMFIVEMEKVLVHKRSVRDAGWYSEHEMKADLKWSPCFGFNSSRVGSPQAQATGQRRHLLLSSR